MKYDYAYPYGLDLSPDSELHKKLIFEIKRRAEESYSKGSSSRNRAREIDKVLYSFVTEKDEENILEIVHNNRPAAPIKIIIPVSKAVLDTWVTYMASAFLSNPYGIYTLRGRGNKESALKALMQEILLNYQAIWFGHDVKYITFWKDCYAYGLGTLMPFWDKHTYKVPAMEIVTEELKAMLGNSVSAQVGDIIRYMKEVTIHEGNNLMNIDFYSVFIDPNTPINDADKFEYAGFFERVNILDYLKKESDPEYKLFNCKYAKDRIQSVPNSNISYGRERDYSKKTTIEQQYFCDVTHFFWKLIPSDWGLSNSEYPEVYYFRIVNNDVIVSCVNLEYLTGSIPLMFGAPNTDGYDTYPISTIATTFGIQKYVDWKLRSQVANQSKALNDMIIVDPFVFEMEDILNPQPGKIIRTKRSMYGTPGIDNYIKQLAVADVTHNNLNDVNNIITLMYQILGTTDIIMGDLSRMPERPTAQGLMIARNSALSRLQKDAQMLVSQMWYKLTFAMACNNILFMDEGVQLNIAGTKFQQILRSDFGFEESNTEHITITPEDLSMDFDVIPLNKFQQETNMQAMAMFLERIIQNPQVLMSIMAEYNIPAIFRQYMRKIGFDNIDDYVVNRPTQIPVQPEIVPDEVARNEMEKGNIIPVAK